MVCGVFVGVSGCSESYKTSRSTQRSRHIVTGDDTSSTFSPQNLYREIQSMVLSRGGGSWVGPELCRLDTVTFF